MLCVDGNQLDAEVLNSLADIEEADELGPAVGQLLADAYNKTMTRPLSKENKERLKQELKIPENCSTFRVPKMNTEIWNRLPQRARLTDIKYQQLQQTLSLGMTVLVKMSDEISKRANQIPKETLTKVFKIGLDGANLMGNQIQDLNLKRKNEVKQYLNADFADICSAKIPVSEYLFGPNLAESLKTSKATSTVMKHSLSVKRYQPYQSARSGSLNFQRPSTPRRGSWNGHQQTNQRYFQGPRSQNQQFQRMPYNRNNYRQK